MISPPTEQQMLQVLDKMNQEGERRGWEKGREAAAEWLESQEGHGSLNRLEYAHGIRKLKKT